MAESIKFSEGVNQIEGASLSAPYDLRNAYIEPAHIVKALNSPSVDSSVPKQKYGKVLLKHANQWFQARSGDYYQSILYTSDDSPSQINAYHADNKNPDKDLPRISGIENVRDGAAALNENRLIMYVFIPINHRGEAGVWRYKMYNTGSNSVLPIWEVDANDNTQYVEVYRTAEMREDIQGEVSQVQSLHYLRRASGDSSIRGLLQEYYTSVPPKADSLSRESASQYYDSDVGYIYLSHNNKWIGDNKRWEGNDMSVGGRDLSGWRVIFRNIYDESNKNLDSDTEYYIREPNTPRDEYKIYLEKSPGGGAFTFNSKAVLKNTSGKPGVLAVYDGVRVDLLPPESVEQAGSNLLVVDGSRWSYDKGEESEERPNQPESRILERDRSLHGRTQVSHSTKNVTSSTFVIDGNQTEYYQKDNIILYDPGSSLVTEISFTSEASVGTTNDVSLSLTTAPTGGLYVRLENIIERQNGDVVINYDVQNGSPNYDVRMERRAAGKESVSDFNRIKTETRQSAGTYEIIDDDSPESGGWDYRIEVSDSNGTVVQSGTTTIYLRTSGFD